MHYKKIKRSKHYKTFHKATLSWIDVLTLINTIKKKRKKGNRIEIEDNKFYILCKIKENVLYVINVKKKTGKAK